MLGRSCRASERLKLLLSCRRAHALQTRPHAFFHKALHIVVHTTYPFSIDLFLTYHVSAAQVLVDVLRLIQFDALLDSFPALGNRLLGAGKLEIINVNC